MSSTTSNSLEISGYVTKILKTLENGMGITLEAKKMIERCIIIFSKKLLVYSNELSLIDQKKILKVRNLENSLELWLIKFPKYKNILNESALLAVENYFSEKYKNNKNKMKSKQKKAKITLPITRVKHYLESLTVKDNISLKSNIYFAGLLDSLCIIICKKAIKNSHKLNKKRLTHTHISHAIQSNDFLSYVYNFL